ncbi:MAG: OmpA family protein [Rhodospirillales bacterium]|nr:OmpA family protein [Rhodospirillales bacterium]
MRPLAVLLAVAGLTACAVAPHAATPQVAAVPGRNYVVFFQEWSAALDASALQTIAAAAGTAAQDPSAAVSVAGFADPLGSVQANIYLTETRAQVVTDQLAADGVAAARIHQHAAGKVPHQLTSQESRRVVISAGGR